MRPDFLLSVGLFRIKAPKEKLQGLPLWKSPIIIASHLCICRTSVRIQGYDRLSYGHQLHQIHERLDSRCWWFVPALIPFILVAPVLSKMFDALDDRTCKIALFVTLGIYAWGGLSSAANSLLINSQHVTFAAAISMLQRIIPRSLLGGTYFTFFCMGYFIKRVTPLLDTRETHFIMASGALFFIIDIASAYYGLDRSDPSFNWMIVTVAIFITFDGIKHQSKSLSKLIE